MLSWLCRRLKKPQLNDYNLLLKMDGAVWPWDETNIQLCFANI